MFKSFSWNMQSGLDLKMWKKKSKSMCLTKQTSSISNSLKYIDYALLYSSFVLFPLENTVSRKLAS